MHLLWGVIWREAVLVALSSHGSSRTLRNRLTTTVDDGRVITQGYHVTEADRLLIGHSMQTYSSNPFNVDEIARMNTLLKSKALERTRDGEH